MFPIPQRNADPFFCRHVFGPGDVTCAFTSGLFDVMKRQKLQLDVICFGAAMTSCAKFHQWQAALALLEAGRFSNHFLGHAIFRQTMAKPWFLCWKAPMPSRIRDLRFLLRHSRRVAQCFFPWTYPIFNVFSWISWLILWPLRRPCCLVNCLLAASASTWLCMFAPWPGVGWKPYSCAAKQVQQQMWLATVPASARVNLGRGSMRERAPKKTWATKELQRVS